MSIIKLNNIIESKFYGNEIDDVPFSDVTPEKLKNTALFMYEVTRNQMYLNEVFFWEEYIEYNIIDLKKIA